jgi:hypothetical protein
MEFTMKATNKLCLALISILSIFVILCVLPTHTFGQGPCTIPQSEWLVYNGPLNVCINQQVSIGISPFWPTETYVLYKNGNPVDTLVPFSGNTFDPQSIDTGTNEFLAGDINCPPPQLFIYWLPPYNSLVITGFYSPASYSLSAVTSPFCYCQHNSGTLRLAGTENNQFIRYELKHVKGSVTTYSDTSYGDGNPIDYTNNDWDWGTYSVVAEDTRGGICHTEMGNIVIYPSEPDGYGTENIKTHSARIFWSYQYYSCINSAELIVSGDPSFNSDIVIDTNVYYGTNYKDLTGLVQNKYYYARLKNYVNNGCYNGYYLDNWSFSTASDSIILKNGWNLISDNIDLTDKNMCHIIEQGFDSIYVKGDHDTTWWHIPPDSSWYECDNPNFEWDYKQGYLFYDWHTDTLYLPHGTVVASNTPIPLVTGWQLVSFLSTDTIFAPTALGSLGSNLVIAKNGYGDLYFPQYGINQLEWHDTTPPHRPYWGEMVPHEGYEMYLITADTLIYPAGHPRISAYDTNLTITNYLTTKYLKTEISNTGNNASMILLAKNMLDGTEIGVYNSNNILIGSSVVNNGVAAVTVWGVNPITKSSIGALSGEQLTIRALDINILRVQNLNISEISEITGKTKSNILNYKTDGIYIVITNDVCSANNLSIGNYPNPFSESTTIEWYLPEPGYANISIYNLYGDKIANIASGEYKEGLFSSQFNNKNLISGAYNLVLRFGSQIISKPLIIEK